MGVDYDWLRTRLQGVTPIKTNIFNQNIKEVVEHYYYIVQVPTKDIGLRPNGIEIEVNNEVHFDDYFFVLFVGM